MEWTSSSASMQLPTSKEQFIKMLIDTGAVEKSMHALELAIALGLRAQARTKHRVEDDPARDIAKAALFDPEGILTEVILEHYGDEPENVRLQRVMEHAMWGIEFIQSHYAENRTLDLKSLLEGAP